MLVTELLISLTNIRTMKKAYQSYLHMVP